MTFDENLEVSVERADELIALDEALTKLAAQDERKGRIAELRYFGGLSVAGNAAVSITRRTGRARRPWQ